MNDSFYLIGQLIQMTDLLHEQYCKQVRDGSIPAQLIGNSLMPVILQNPVKGLARLNDRIRVYKAWAQAGKKGDVRLARWALRRMADVSAQLASNEASLPVKADDAGQAQLLLGYLGRVESPEPTPTTETDTEEISEENA